MDNQVESVTIVIDGKTCSVELSQSQGATSRRGAGRSGKDMLEAAVRDARAWLRANGRAAGDQA